MLSEKRQHAISTSVQAAQSLVTSKGRSENRREVVWGRVIIVSHKDKQPRVGAVRGCVTQELKAQALKTAQTKTVVLPLTNDLGKSFTGVCASVYSSES